MTGSSSSSTGLGTSSSLVGTSGPGSSSGSTGPPSAGVLPRSAYDTKPVVHHRRKKKDPDMPKRNM